MPVSAPTGSPAYSCFATLNATLRPPRAKRLLTSLCAVSLLVTSLVPPAAMAQDRLPALGDAASEDLSVGSERRIGEQVMREIRRDPDYLDDPVLLEYLQSVWQPLVKASRDRGNISPDIDQAFAWEPFLVRDRSVNAFALPGGFVGVNLGLIAMTTTRDELASVLAHEMSHVTQRHIARGMANSQRQSLIGLASMILGILAALRSHRLATGEDGVGAVDPVAARGRQDAEDHRRQPDQRLALAVGHAARDVALGDVRHFVREHRGQFLSLIHI